MDHIEEIGIVNGNKYSYIESCIEWEIVIGDVGFKTWMSYGCDEKLNHFHNCHFIHQSNKYGIH